MKWTKATIENIPEGEDLFFVKVIDTHTPGNISTGRFKPAKILWMIQQSMYEVFYLDESESTLIHNGWIDVKERLPEKLDEEYLVVGGKNKIVTTLNYSKKGWYSDVFKGYVTQDKITHWQPFPSPPNKEKTDNEISN